MAVVNFDWTDEAVEALRRLAKQGNSATQIAAAMSARYEWMFTRNAIIGKAMRVGIRLGVKAGAPPVETKKPKIQKPAPPKPKTAREAKPMPMPVVIEKPVVEIVVPVSRRVTLTELTGSTCRWPVNNGGPFLFCGAHGASFATGRPYCAEHTQIAFVPTKRQAPPSEHSNMMRRLNALKRAAVSPSFGPAKRAS
jgi:GcrA cell cycle regulator